MCQDRPVIMLLGAFYGTVIECDKVIFFLLCDRINPKGNSDYPPKLLRAKVGRYATY